MEIEPHSPWTSSTILSSLACDSSSFGLGVIPVAPKLLGKVILIVKSTIIKCLCKTPLAKHRKNTPLKVHVSQHHNANMCTEKLN